MRTVIIPARGGSKGVPRKNAKYLNGEPLIARCVRTCLKADVDAVIVSTEDLAIAEIAGMAGALVCWRPAELATDDAPAGLAIQHCLEQYPCDTVVLVQCTAPLLTHRDIDGTVAKLTDGIDLAVCAIPFHGVVCDDNGPINYDPKSSPNRQKRKHYWQVSGHCWAMRPEYLEEPWMSGVLAFHPAESSYHLEIDTMDDWNLASRIIYEPYSGYTA